MNNPSRFKKGELKKNQGKRGLGKTTVAARQAIAAFVDGNADKLQGWLEEIAKEKGAQAAFDTFTTLLEYHVPKLARHETTGNDGGPVKVEIQWMETE